ncbi:MAG: hypothetical protein EXR79_13755 [Myxococcales bacterium]|nr:hypothetical protein [Myxococcales bacterium]
MTGKTPGWDRWVRRALAGAALAGVAGSWQCAAHRSKKYFAACAQADECESGLCSDGHCSQPCVANPDCGSAALCVDNTCRAKLAACDDGNFCTVGDVMAGGRCIAGDPLPCGPDDECRVWDCDKKKGCFANALHVDAPCNASATATQGPMRCAPGSTDTNGCRCAVWQGTLCGPGDDCKVGAKVIDRPDEVAHAVAAGVGALLVGSTRPDPAGPRLGWVARTASTGKLLWSKTYSAAVGSPDQALARVVATSEGGWLAVGSGGGDGRPWALRLDAVGDVITSHLGNQAGVTLRGLAAVDGGWLAVGTSKTPAGAAAVPIASDGKLAQAVPVTPLEGSAADAVLHDLARAGSQWMGVGAVGVQGARRAWAVRLLASGGVAAQVVRPEGGFSESVMLGVVSGPDSGWAGFGFARLLPGTPGTAAAQLGWTCRVTASAAFEKDQYVSGEDGKDVAFAAGTVLPTGGILAVGSRSGGEFGWTVRLTSGAALPFAKVDASRALVAAAIADDAVILAGVAKATQDGWLLRADFGGRDKCLVP